MNKLLSKCTFILFVILIPTILLAQKKTYLGFEIGPKLDMYKYTDSGNSIYTRPLLFAPFYGFTIGQEINSFITLETGFQVNDYGEGYRLQGVFGYSISNALIVFEIPLRVKANLPLLKNKIFVNPTFGYTLAINTEYDASLTGFNGSGSGISTTNGLGINSSTVYEERTNSNLVQAYGLIETAIALEFRFKKASSIFISTRYMKGFTRVVDIEVDYWIDEEPMESASVFSTGDYVSITVGYKYPISHFWKKKKPQRS